MDRRQFILAKGFEGDGSICDEDDCLCEDVTTEKKEHTTRVTPGHTQKVTLTAFLAAVSIVVIETNYSNAVVLQKIKENSLACGPTARAENRKHSIPSENKNGNCPHHFASSVAVSSDDRRKKTHIC